METPESLTTCNEPSVEKIPEEEEVSRDDVNIEEELKDASSCTGFEKDEWYKYSTIVNILLVTLLFVTFSLIVAMTVYLLRILFMVIIKHLYTTQSLKKEL
ncbi:uncharacterized protein LOC113558627 isoform X2 [Rhopalosiphum maidis]|uniref:uncharacterized protein LOC113558627 isoform X2 n=1 Tax=Rhopalosiphum maidis TaxID=43146 RepID=UPI000EFF5FF7|nr:uncharacterized protein LOC113558627 isoform X2 [Rhopalosiphum maidis]